MKELWLDDPLGERPLAPSELPLTVGGPGAAVVIPGCRPGELRARVALDAGGLAITPEPGAGKDALDGVAISFEDRGGRPTIVVRHGGVANVTRPPQFEGRASGAADTGDDRLPIEIVDYEPRARATIRKPVQRHWGKPLVWAAVAAVVAVLGFLLTATSVEVTTSAGVAPDHVDFDGTAFDFGFRGRYLVPPGDYQLAVAAEGFAPAIQPVTVGNESGQRIVIALERLPGRVAIDTGGIAGTLSVDGVPKGVLPGTFELPAGTRELTIAAPRHAGQQIRFEVAGGGEEQALEVALAPLFAKLTVTSVPEGATVWADDQELGRTPLETELDAGRYTLALLHPEYRRFEGPLTVKAGEPQVVGPIELGMPDGRLIVSSRPAGADVSIGGSYRGRTPLTIGVPPGMPQEVLLTLAGHAPASETVNIESRAERRLSFDLTPVLGEIRVRGEPADALLFVDGASRGPANNQTLSLPAAPHVIEVRKPGLESFRATVTPRKGQPQLIEYTLRTAGEARTAAMPARRSTGLGQEMVLVTGGRFTMGSARREPGRRSNETERVVVLQRPFYLSRFQVTNREFREFRAEHLSGIFKDESLDLDRQPVARVTWSDAAAFCNWLSKRDGLPEAYVQRGGRLELADPVNTGYRLPTEAEWEFAARFDGSQATRKYPWGNGLPVPARSGNWGDATAIYLTPVTISGYEDGYRVAAPVGSYPANPLGIHDLGGNVLEWTTDRYSIYVVGPDHISTDPVGPRAGDNYVIRGAGWLTGKIPELRTASRDSGNAARPDLGFRIARYAE